MERLSQKVRTQMVSEFSKKGLITIKQYQLIGEFIKQTNTISIVNNLVDFKQMVGVVEYAKIEDSLVRIFTALKEDIKR